MELDNAQHDFQRIENDIETSKNALRRTRNALADLQSERDKFEQFSQKSAELRDYGMRHLKKIEEKYDRDGAARDQ